MNTTNKNAQQQQQQQQQDQYLKLAFINAKKYKHLLKHAISVLSTKSQINGGPIISGTGNFVVLSIDNEALEYIEKLILDLFNSILLASSDYYDTSPESDLSRIMSNTEATSQQQITQANASVLNSSLVHSNLILSPILDLEEAKCRIIQVLPRAYADGAILNAQKCVDKYNTLKPKKRFNIFSPNNQLLKSTANSALTSNLMYTSTSSGIGSSLSSTDLDLAQMFTFPTQLIYRIHDILAKEIFQSKVYQKCLNVTIFLVNILETITKDILDITSNYVRILQKYTITKKDVNTTILANHMFTEIFFSATVGGIPNQNKALTVYDEDFEFEDDEDDMISNKMIEFEDELVSSKKKFFNFDYPSASSGLDNLIFGKVKSATTSASSFTNPHVSNAHKSTKNGSISPSTNLGSAINITNLSTSGSNEECTSDTSTICAESAEQLNQKYYLKVMELNFEQSQHLFDLNVLRRIFMYLFQKCCTQYDIKLDEGDEKGKKLIDSIFGNLNDVYECALRLYDSLEELITAMNQKQKGDEENQQILAQATPAPTVQNVVTIGQQLWDLAEGNEFDVYRDFALRILNNKSSVISSIKLILNNANAKSFLKETSPGLAEISNYLLTTLLVGSLYHYLYLYETIEYLHQIATDDEDKACLKDSLDTLKPIHTTLNELKMTSSKRRPIESSFRMFQLQSITNQNTMLSGAVSNATLTNNTTTSTSSISHISSAMPVSSSRVQPLASNICSKTESKWKEIELSVDSLKSPLINSQSMSQSVSSSSNIKLINHAYLYEGNVSVYRANQPIQSPKGAAQSKLKSRFAYLFESQIILVKKQQPGSKNKAKFKECIQLDKCSLLDRDDDENCFELVIFNNATLQQEHILFILDNPSEKFKWMSMLCYAKYKFTIDRLLQTMNEEHNKNNPLPIPPKDYLFNLPDSSEFILFEQLNELQNTHVSSDGLLIEAASLIKLVECLTHHLYLLPKFSNTFLMFFREFCTTREFLALLSERYDVPDLNVSQLENKYNFHSGGITQLELTKRYRREYQQPIKLKVINVIKHWIDGYYNHDFASDPELLKSLEAFIEKVGRTNKNYQTVLSKVLEKKMAQSQLKDSEDVELNTDKVSLCSTSSSNTSKSSSDLYNMKNFFKLTFPSTNSSLNSSFSSRSSSTSTNEDNAQDAQSLSSFVATDFATHLEEAYGYDILTIHPLEFARQVTLMESKLFRAIKPNELITLGWTRSKQEEKLKLSPNVMKISYLWNKFTYWYAKCIVDTPNLEERVHVVKRILDIAFYFYQMNNFSGLKAIYAGLELSSVHRLKITVEESGLEKHYMYEKCRDLFGDHDKGYLSRIKNCSPPCVPFLGTHLKNICQVQEYNKLTTEDKKIEILKQQEEKLKKDEPPVTPTENKLTKTNLILFSQYRLLVEFVNDLLQYQNVAYKISVNEKVRSFLIEDIINFFETAQNSILSSEDSMLELNQTALEEFVNQWLYDKSKLLEPNDVQLSEVLKYPRVKTYPLKSPPLISNLNVNKPKPLNSSSSITTISSSKISDTNNNKIETARSQSATRYNKQKSLTAASKLAYVDDSQATISSASKSIFSAPAGIKASSSINKLANTAENKSGSKVPALARSSSTHSDKSLQNRRSGNQNQLLNRLKIPTNKFLERNSASSSPSPSPSPSPLQLKPSNLLFGDKNFHAHLIDPTQLKVSSSDSSDTDLSLMDPNHSKNYYNMSNQLDKKAPLSLAKQQQTQKPSLNKSESSSSSTTSITQQSLANASSPPFSLLSHKASLSASQVTQICDSSSLLSQATASTSSVSGLIQNHGLEKLSISSADSSSVPNSPPPNYEELISNDVFDTNMPVAQNSANCFDNKTYFQRIYNLSLNNLRGTGENVKITSLNLSPKQKQHDSPLAPSPTTTFTASSTIGAASKILNKDTNIFAFPDLNEANKSSTLLNKQVPSRPPLPPPAPTDAHQSRAMHFASASFHSLSLPPPPEPPRHPPSDAPQLQPLHHANTASFHSSSVPPPSEPPRAPVQPPALPPRPKKNVKN